MNSPFVSIDAQVKFLAPVIISIRNSFIDYCEGIVNAKLEVYLLEYLIGCVC